MPDARPLPSHPIQNPAPAGFFRLAAVWLACRHELLHEAVTDNQRFFAFQGELDYSVEMLILLEETNARNARVV